MGGDKARGAPQGMDFSSLHLRHAVRAWPAYDLISRGSRRYRAHRPLHHAHYARDVRGAERDGLLRCERERGAGAELHAPAGRVRGRTHAEPGTVAAARVAGAAAAR
jgi:hypothetical protein